MMTKKWFKTIYVTLPKMVFQNMGKKTSLGKEIFTKFCFFLAINFEPETQKVNQGLKRLGL